MNAIGTWGATTMLVCAACAAQAEAVYGITVPRAAGSSLVRFDSAAPNAVTTIGAVSGIVAGQTLRGIDFRPATGDLYAISSSGAAAQLYTIDLGSGAATPVGAGITLTGNTSTRISLDFNPVVDRLRIVTGSRQNYRLNVDTGVLTQDTNISGTPLISGIAYSDNLPGATQTTLYAYDFLLDNLGTIGGLNGVPSPNGGLFSLIGNSGIVTGDAGLGFDISGATGIGYISVDDFNNSPGANAEFFSVNLATGALTQISNDDFAAVLDISVAIQRPGSVPLPATWGLILLGGAALGAARRMRRAR